MAGRREADDLAAQVRLQRQDSDARLNALEGRLAEVQKEARPSRRGEREAGEDDLRALLSAQRRASDARLEALQAQVREIAAEQKASARSTESGADAGRRGVESLAAALASHAERSEARLSSLERELAETRRRMSDEADRWRSERRPSSHFPAPASGQLGEGDGSDTPTMRRLRQAAATQEAAAQRALAEAREEGGAQVRELIAEVRLLRDEERGRRAARAAEDDVRGGPQSRADALMRSEAVRAAEQRAAEVGARLRHVEAESESRLASVQDQLGEVRAAHSELKRRMSAGEAAASAAAEAEHYNFYKAVEDERAAQVDARLGLLDEAENHRWGSLMQDALHNTGPSASAAQAESRLNDLEEKLRVAARSGNAPAAQAASDNLREQMGRLAAQREQAERERDALEAALRNGGGGGGSRRDSRRPSFDAGATQRELSSQLEAAREESRRELDALRARAAAERHEMEQRLADLEREHDRAASQRRRPSDDAREAERRRAREEAEYERQRAEVEAQRRRLEAEAAAARFAAQQQERELAQKQAQLDAEAAAQKQAEASRREAEAARREGESARREEAEAARRDADNERRAADERARREAESAAQKQREAEAASKQADASRREAEAARREGDERRKRRSRGGAPTPTKSAARRSSARGGRGGGRRAAAAAAAARARAAAAARAGWRRPPSSLWSCGRRRRGRTPRTSCSTPR